MKQKFTEINYDLWELHALGFYVCITTNGIIKANGELVMGAGIAKQAAAKFPWLPKKLAALVTQNDNRVFELPERLISFPTKHHWRNKSDIKLIKKSAKELMEIVNKLNLDWVILPRPGCNNGQLSWESEVKPALIDVLDKRVVVVSRG